MGRRGPKFQTAQTRQKISESMKQSTTFRRSVEARSALPKRKDSIETRARKAAGRRAPAGTALYQFEYELALQRIALLDNQERRRAYFLNRAAKE